LNQLFFKVTIVNEATRQAEAVQKMLSIQNRFADVLFYLFIYLFKSG